MATASEIAAVGVIGAGQMGSGIAQLAAAAGCAVLLLDADSAALSRAVASISASLRRLAAKGQLSQVSALTSQSTLPTSGLGPSVKEAAFSFLPDKFWVRLVSSFRQRAKTPSSGYGASPPCKISGTRIL